ncbi:MAG: hypothetical protein K6F23_03740 [Solobacterium sp.]|nr:hypothetical protein [Solobacterium sp.]
MLVREVADLLNAAPLARWDDEVCSRNYEVAFATDLMSDALLMIQSDPEKTILITGLANAQTLRTAEMLDLQFIVFVRSKYLDDNTIEMARNMGLCAISTDYTMYETCGILYAKGLDSIHGKRTA